MKNSKPLSSKPRAVAAIGVGGVIVGVLDLAYAILVYSPKRPILIPQTIATGVLGRQSYREGLASAALGVLLHFTIALGAAATYYLASRKLPFLIGHAVVSGLVYGALVYVFMHWVVLPLSGAPPSRLSSTLKAIEFVEHWFFVGLPISLSVARYCPEQAR